MRFAATDVFDYYKPSRCARRVALIAAGVPQQETDSDFARLLRQLGARHEEAHLATFAGIVNLGGLEAEDRERRTLEAIRDRVRAIYQPRFRAILDVDGESCELVGEPDFLLLDGDTGRYAIRDSKLAKNVLSKNHAGIPLQLQIYGFLYERATGESASRLEVHAGSGEIIPIEYLGAAHVLGLLGEHRRLRSADPDAYEPVGWTKCAGCGYEDRCWSGAEAAQDVSLLTCVPQNRARELHRLGIDRIAAIQGAVDDPANRDFFWTGKKKPHLKDFVPSLLTCAQSHLENRPILLDDRPPLPAGPSFAMLDLEGMPPHLDELDRIYLWGVKVCGERPSGYLPAQAGFAPTGDREGWFAFLDLADRLFEEHGPELPFVHWSGYETGKLKSYIDRYGDPNGIAARVLTNSVDLLGLLKDTVVLPVESYSLKVVDTYVGFERRLEEANGAWSMAKYVEATETSDPSARQAIVNQILAYNEEDLDATWAVMEWIRRGSVNPAVSGGSLVTTPSS